MFRSRQDHLPLFLQRGVRGDLRYNTPMSNRSEQKSLLIIISVFLFVVFGTYAITLIARGYRPSLQPGGVTLSATGLLSATSQPKGASVFVNNALITATDDTINLSPGDYLIKIAKDGYFSWQKNIKIKKETVFQTDAQLFRSSPDLKPITQTGAINPIISPDYTKIIYSVASASASINNGLYLIEISPNLIYLTKNTPQQIAPNFPGIDWSKATLTFSPNGQEVLANFKQFNTNYLINLSSPIKNPPDVTAKLSIISKDWAEQEQLLVQQKIDQLPKDVKAIVSTDSAQKISFSPGDDKILYEASTDTQLPDQIISPPPAQSTQNQSRTVNKGNYYVYDIKDDTNFYIGSSSSISLPFWLQNSNNLVYIEKQTVKAIDYDASNQITLFTLNETPPIVSAWTDGNKMIVLTSAYAGAQPNLYAVTIR